MNDSKNSAKYQFHLKLNWYVIEIEKTKMNNLIYIWYIIECLTINTSENYMIMNSSYYKTIHRYIMPNPRLAMQKRRNPCEISKMNK